GAGERGGTGGAGCVADAVGLAPALVEERERGFDRAGVEEVALQADGGGCTRRDQILLGRPDVGVVTTEHRDATALGREEVGGGAAHAARPAGDADRPISQPQVHGQAASWRARCAAVSGSPVARSTRRSQRSDAPGRKTSSTRSRPAAGSSTTPPARVSSVAWSWEATSSP